MAVHELEELIARLLAPIFEDSYLEKAEDTQVVADTSSGY